MLCDNLEACDGVGSGTEVQEGGDILIAESHCCMADTTQNCKALILQKKKKTNFLPVQGSWVQSLISSRYHGAAKPRNCSGEPLLLLVSELRPTFLTPEPTPPPSSSLPKPTIGYVEVILTGSSSGSQWKGLKIRVWGFDLT